MKEQKHTSKPFAQRCKDSVLFCVEASQNRKDLQTITCNNKRPHRAKKQDLSENKARAKARNAHKKVGFQLRTQKKNTNTKKTYLISRNEYELNAVQSYIFLSVIAREQHPPRAKLFALSFFFCFRVRLFNADRYRNAFATMGTTDRSSTHQGRGK